MKSRSFSLPCVCALCLGTNIQAQTFTSRRTLELGGNLAFSYQSRSDNTHYDLTLFALSAYCGLMVLPGFEIGLYPTFTSTSVSGYSSTNMEIFLAPAYNF